MPEISRFYGIVIRMYFRDHEPPHFHALYRGQEARVSIRPVRVVEGWLPPRAQALVVEWAARYTGMLMDNWRRLRADEPPHRIPPLE